ncbi:alpha/beta hydrolase [Actinocorallia sp. A-T 12471]|uniref:alpha/beta hydrolase n=1 Tax=Actinocorallia sp. A-T 12471 TaxID=3089813 RepID=UPI0029D3EFC4|nr:alpha/beta hydrolase [Actinocorallia sp. A-T 12471]MDX6740407.1 alpha/beta hydrolase [Actinocorallia sp. A-T 12471]
MTDPVLEPAAQAFANATANPPYLHDLPPDEARAALADAQRPPLPVPGVVRGRLPEAGLTVYRPSDAAGALPVVVYLHGGWVFGDEDTHGSLAGELARASGAAVAFVHYSRAPEARYPVALDQARAALDFLAGHGRALGLDPARVAVAGDSTGGTLAAALTLLARDRLRAQVLLYPATDASFDTPSYLRFAEGYYLRRDGMRRLWDHYLPDLTQRDAATACPLRAKDRDLYGLPPALVVTAEADVLRDEGESYAARLRAARVPVAAVRYQGVIHDFATLHCMRATRAARQAIDQAGRFLARELGTAERG